jgi:hypothetical protein
MSRSLSERLRKLEQRQPPRPMRWHRIIGHAEAELAKQRSALEASPIWTAGDGVIERLIVEPAPRKDEQPQP